MERVRGVVERVFDEAGCAVVVVVRSTDQGRAILRDLGYSADPPPFASQEERCLSLEHRARITIAPLPKNMDPDRHAERRRIRTNVLSKTLQRLGPVKYVYYVDAHPGEDEGGITAVVGPLNYELVTIEPDVHAIDDLETRSIARAMYAATTHIVRPQAPIIIVTDSRALVRGRRLRR